MKKLGKLLSVALISLLTLGVVGCGKKDDASMSDLAKESINYTFALDADFKVEGIVGDVTDIQRYSDGFIILGDEFYFPEASEGDAEFIVGVDNYTVYKVPFEGGTAEKIDEPKPSDGAYVRQILVNDSGYCGYITSPSTEDDTERIYIYENGSYKEPVPLREVAGVSADEWLQRCVCDNNGNLFFQFDSQIVVVDKDMKQAATYNSEAYIEGISLDKKGNAVVVESVEGSQDKPMKSKVYDEKSKSFSNEREVPITYFETTNSLVRGNGDYDLFYLNAGKMYGYKYSDESSKIILDFYASDISADDVGSITPLSNETFISKTAGSEGSVVTRYNKVDPETIKDRKILTYMSLYESYDMKQAILEFNRSHTDVRINMINYSGEMDPMGKMSADIAAGNLPDIYDISSGNVGGMSVEQCMAKGMFEDMTPFLSADPELSEEDFIPNILEAMKTDGKLYRICPSFSIMTLMGRASDIGEEPGWNFSEMKAYVDEQDEEVRLFETTNKSQNLDYFLYGGMNDFVDWETGKCTFDSPEFKDLLMMCDRGNNDQVEWDQENSIPNLMKNNQLLFIQGGLSPEDMQMYTYLFEGDISFKGYPNEDRNGTFVNFYSSLAVSSKSAYKDEAWEFLRTLLTEEYESEDYQVMYRLPVRQDVFEEYMNYITNTEEGATDKYGNEMLPISTSIGWYDMQIDIHPFTEEEAKEYRSLVESADGVWSYDMNIDKIVQEEAKAFFEGDKSVDDVTFIIQNRANTYINENK